MVVFICVALRLSNKNKTDANAPRDTAVQQRGERHLEAL